MIDFNAFQQANKCHSNKKKERQCVKDKASAFWPLIGFRDNDLSCHLLSPLDPTVFETCRMM